MGRGSIVVNWSIDYERVRLCLRTAATNGPIVHPPSDMWVWRTMVVVMMPAGDNSWLVHQSSLAILSGQTSGASRRNGRRSENFAYQYLKYLKGSFSLTTWDLRLYFPSEGRCAADFIALTNPSPRPGLNPRPLGPVASTPTTTPPRRQKTG
jgi:hypothetical protein